MPYRNFRTIDSGLGNLLLLSVFVTLGLIGLFRPIDARDLLRRLTDAATTQLAVAQPRGSDESARENVPERSAPSVERETSRILAPHDETTAQRTVRGLHHDRDLETPSTESDPVPGSRSANEDSLEPERAVTPLRPEKHSADEF